MNEKKDDTVKQLLKPVQVTLLNMVMVVIFAAGLGAGLALLSSMLGIIIVFAAGVLVVVKIYEKIIHG